MNPGDEEGRQPTAKRDPLYDSGLKIPVLIANLALAEAGLTTLSWGNASGSAGREANAMAIKPSGIACGALDRDCNQIVVVSLEDGAVLEGKLRPSSDTPTHRHLYRAWPGIGGIVHVHSPYACAFAQAGRDLPCLGTTHADHFRGAVPVTRPLTDEEASGDEYELNVGRAIVECFERRRLAPAEIPAVLVHGHGSFVWGRTPQTAVENAVALELCARVAALTLGLNPSADPIPDTLRDRHFLRKHGPHATYGQGG